MNPIKEKITELRRSIEATHVELRAAVHEARLNDVLLAIEWVDCPTCDAAAGERCRSFGWPHYRETYYKQAHSRRVKNLHRLVRVSRMLFP